MEKRLRSLNYLPIKNLSLISKTALRSFKTEGIIIKRRNFGEADRILTVFTKRLGKIQVKAVGVRRITSRRSPHVELLNLSALTLHKGKSLPILTEAQTIEDFSLIKDSLIKVGFAYHICELVDGLCPENQENGRVFDLLSEVLFRLEHEEDIASVIHEFEVELLTILGYYKPSWRFQSIDTTSFIESILERRLKSKRILPLLL